MLYKKERKKEMLIKSDAAVRLEQNRRTKENKIILLRRWMLEAEESGNTAKMFTCQKNYKMLTGEYFETTLEGWM